VKNSNGVAQELKYDTINTWNLNISNEVKPTELNIALKQ
jgi:hypothetical protein